MSIGTILLIVFVISMLVMHLRGHGGGHSGGCGGGDAHGSHAPESSQQPDRASSEPTGPAKTEVDKYAAHNHGG